MTREEFEKMVNGYRESGESVQGYDLLYPQQREILKGAAEGGDLGVLFNTFYYCGHYDERFFVSKNGLKARIFLHSDGLATLNRYSFTGGTLHTAYLGSELFSCEETARRAIAEKYTGDYAMTETDYNGFIAAFRNDNKAPAIDRKMAKAIRMVMGYNSDLRVKLYGFNKEIYNFIWENRYGILGVSVAIRMTESFIKEPHEYEWTEAVMREAVNMVVYGDIR